MDDIRWNDSTVVRGQLTIKKFIARMANSSSIILHFAGLKKKPWSGWRSSYVEFEDVKPIYSPLTVDDMSLYMFSWDQKEENTVLIKTFPDYGYAFLRKERMFFQPFHTLADTKYVGVFNPLWTDRNKDNVAEVYGQKPEERTVLAHALVEKGWASHVPELRIVFNELERKFGVTDGDTINPLAVVCQRELFFEWAKSWREMFLHLQSKYGDKLMPEKKFRNDLFLKLPNYISMLFFADQSIKKKKLII